MGVRILLALLCAVFSVVKADGVLWYQDLCSYRWEAIDPDKNVKYSLKLCDSSPDTGCGRDSAVCASSLATGTKESVGDLSQQTASTNVLDFGSSRKCSGVNRTVRSSISFQCGKTMGTPEFVTVSECVHYFEWRTYATCKNDKFKPHKEVPCYVFDASGKKHDLNPLIKVTDGYLVDDLDDEVNLYINICRSITRADGSCPEGSAACLINSKGSFSMGRPTGPLQLLSSDRLLLHYNESTDRKPDFCGEHSPAVTLTLICPSERQDGSDPRVTAKTNCRYEIEWGTEYACHRDYLESQDCTLTSSQHDVSIDLTPLTLEGSEQSYSAESKSADGRDTYTYYLNACGETQAGGCSDATGYVSVCQVKDGEEVKKIAGRYKNQTLRYSDGDLTLIYPGGSPCSSGFQRMTIVNFECNKTAENDGRGSPVFTGETDCTYYFDWHTKYACVKEKENLLCSVSDGKKHYHLSRLTRLQESGALQNWEAVEGGVPESDRKRFYINVCHKIIQQEETKACPEDAAICAVANGKAVSLGKFLTSPQKGDNGLTLTYTEGDECLGAKSKIRSVVSLFCKPGDLESAPLLQRVSSDGCVYEFEWHTASACVQSKAEGDNCRVSDPLAGFSFDLSPLTKHDAIYNVSNDDYIYYLNVCGSVPAAQCRDSAGACQVDKSGKSWSLGVSSARLTYYDGLIQLNYRNGTQYNDEKHTHRSTLISFLCDHEAGVGQPEYQVEDKFTYNFKWYTSYACPEKVLECMVTDPMTLKQYDLSSLSRSEGHGMMNWEVLDLVTNRKYYINVCRPLNAVAACDRSASVCEAKYEQVQGVAKETVSISNLGVAKSGPVIEDEGHLLLEYTGGSSCISNGQPVTYTTRIHLVCSQKTTASRLFFVMIQNCTATFMWHTEAACPISTIKDTNNTCSLKDPNTGFEFNLNPLASVNGYTAEGNGKTFKVNICGSVKDCGLDNGKPVPGCEIEDGLPQTLVGVERSLQFSTDGVLTLTYKGDIDKPTGTQDTFTISFVCDQDQNPGSLTLLREDMSTSSSHVVHDAFFQFHTALVCMPAPVDCRVIDSHGNEYDLSDLSRDDRPWEAIDASSQTKSQKFYINICNPLPPVPGCPGGALGACALFEGKGINLGYVQSSPQAASDGSISIVYLGGDRCDSGRYSTRIIFVCDDTPGSPMFDRKDGCEYVFVWRTSEACPIHRVQGTNCKVTEPRSGHVFDMTPLSGEDYVVQSGKYQYHFAVCAALRQSVCEHQGQGGVASCQVEGNTHRVAGLATQDITYDDGLLMINYTQGEKCHKIYERSTAILFTCDHSRSVGKPEFIKETPDCTYLFEWHTALACLPFKTTSCTFNDGNGTSYDLSPLTLSRDNWVAEHETGNPEERYYINVCKSLVPQSGSWTCPSNAASCLKVGEKYSSLGQAESGPRIEKNILVLRYTSGEMCPDGVRNKTTIIRFKCNKDKVDSRPMMVMAIQDCVYTFMWATAAACPLKTSEHGDCKVTNPATGHLFDLNSLNKEGGYTVYDGKDAKKIFRLNVCGEAKNFGCDNDAGVCLKADKLAVSAGKFNKNLSYRDQVLQLTYQQGSPCEANRTLQHKSIISFVCKPGGSTEDGPVLVVSDLEHCTHYFSWHTALVCEQQVRCSVKNGTSIIDLTPLVHKTGYYRAVDEDLDKDKSPDFYINICQPLNPIPGVNCPAGAAVCVDPPDGPPVDIGRITLPPLLGNNEVSINFTSNTPCGSNPSETYSSVIRFTCQRGTDLGSPQMISRVQCVYVFEWATPLLCPDVVTTSGCTLQDSQLQFTFDLSSLKDAPRQVSSSTGTYKVNLCGAAPDPKCKDSAVCLISGGSGVSFGNKNAISMDYRHEDEAVIMQYGGGDPCPPVTDKGDMCVFPFIFHKQPYSQCTKDGRTDGKMWCATTSSYDRDQQWGFCAEVKEKRRSSILFTCDRGAGRGSPELVSETLGCAATFQWATDVVCPPKKMECKLVHQHQTYDLRTLSSLTGPWKFTHSGDSYYLNLCQGIHGGLTDCPESATVCRKPRNGRTQALGQVYTQSMEYIGAGTNGRIWVNYTQGDAACGNGKPAKTVVQLVCGSTVGTPKLLRVDENACEFWVTWETRAACAVTVREVEMVNGTIKVPDTGTSFSLGALYNRLHKASGDIRSNGDVYIYDIQLSGITNGSSSNCQGAYICQVKINNTFTRKIGSSRKVKYFIKDGNLDVLVASDSTCGRDQTKTVSSTILFHCSPSAGEGIPQFLLEADGCQYLFVWHTAAVCELFAVDNDKQSTDDGEEPGGLSGRSQAVGAVLSLLLVVLTVCLLILLLYKRERRELVIQKVTGCCRRGGNISYKYSKVNTEEEGCEDEMEWLMEEMEPPDRASRSGKESQENGHIRTKRVNAEVLRAFPLDEQDSEDEVLTLPSVHVQAGRHHTPAQPRAGRDSDEDLVGLLEDERRGRPKRKEKARKKVAQLPASFHDDSDEDLLKV